jgi:hypothetical protein
MLMAMCVMETYLILKRHQDTGVNMSQNVNHRHFIENEILRRVNKPSQYLGTELNSVHKDLDTVDLRFSLVFPDM